jgi:hypothetical protein
MDSLLRIVGTEIWIGPHLLSSGLTGPAYAEKLREAERLDKWLRDWALDQQEELKPEDPLPACH